MPVGLRRALAAGAAALTLSAALAAVSTTPATAAPNRPWLDAAQTPDTRARQVLAQMTLAEKVDLMTGNQGEAPYAYYNAPIVRLGIPALKMADASGGVAPRGWSLADTGTSATAMPTPQAMASTWDTSQVARYASVVAQEVLNTGQNLLLGPDSDIIRQPWWGRADETESEDPILTGKLLSTYVKTVEDKGVIANLKHYAAYNQETNRGNGQNSIVDERTLREVYTLAFEAVVKQAGLGSVMCSFNKINGVYSCEDARTLKGILKGQIGFTGFVLSDFGALHSTVGGLQGTTDMETGTTTIYDGALLAAVQNGSASVGQLNQSCLRILTTMFEYGIFDRSFTPSPIAVTADDRVARETEEQAITLLKNDGGALPLTAASKSIAVIGADANFIAAPSGAPWVQPTRTTTTLQGIQQSFGGTASVSYTPGNDPVGPANMLETPTMTAIPSSVLTPSSGSGTGLTGYYWQNTGFQGAPAVVQTDKQVNYDVGFLSTFAPWGGKSTQVPAPPVGANQFTQQSVVWEGFITAPKTGAYTLSLTGFGDATLTLDGNQVVTMTGADLTRSVADSPALTLTAGERHSLKITYQADHPFSSLEIGTLLLQWKTPGDVQSPAVKQAVAAAKAADTAVVYVRTFEGEQRDRVSLHLPQSADTLVRAVRAANPNTVVVLANASPVTMPWLAQVPAVVQTYFGGQQQGSALGRVLSGAVNPSGKLTVTYPTSDTAVPSGTTNPWATAGSLDVLYGDGVNVGYKGYDRQGITPLFPFGYGLSYTTFGYSGLTVTPGATPTAPIRVRFAVTNTGSVAGAEAAQVYFGLPAAAGEAPRRLVGFTKVTLAPGQRRFVDVMVDPTDGTHPLDWFDASRSAWRTAAGTYTVSVGASSRNLPLTATFGIATGT